MNRWQKWRQERWFRILTHKFTLATLGFLIWMIWLDANSLVIHHQLNEQISQLEENIDYYQENIQKDQQRLQQLNSDPAQLEKFVREEYYYHRPGERIYLLPDSVRPQSYE